MNWEQQSVVQAVPVAYEDLPVTLPTVTQFQGHDKGISPLSSAQHWLTAKCAKYSTYFFRAVC